MVTIDSTVQLLISLGWQQDSLSSFVVTFAPHAMMAIAKSSRNKSFSEKSEKLELSDKSILPYLMD
jgi:FAD synthase